jgi:DNA-binding CsgD family transcriptional regulator
VLGREEERLALERLLAEAREGRSGVLALVGEPGIGKTALLDHAAARADGMRVLRARGVESEAEVPFAGLAELLRAALAAFDRVPPPQAKALAGALALAPAAENDRFAIGAATLSLLSAYAEEAPLLLLVDDVHLLDGSSAGALLFAARRLLADPIAVILAAREGEPSLLDGADIRVLRVAGLGRAEAAELVGPAIADAAVERLFLATGGNPLALLELAPDAARLATLPPGGPVPISTEIAAAFVRRFGRLGDRTRRVLVLAAASDSGDLAVLARAATALEADLEDLAAAEEAGLVRLDAGRVEFVHPLARSALYADAPPTERRAAHAALARALPDRDVDRRAWHLASASVGPNRDASVALEQAGTRARERSAYSVAAAAFERGGRLAPADEDRAALLYAAADAAWLAGDAARTLSLLDDAEPHATAAPLAARIAFLRGQVAMRRGPVMDGYALVLAAVEQIADTDPELAVVWLAQAVHACMQAGDTRSMVSAAERTGALARGQTSRRASFFAAMAACMALVADGRGEEGAAAARRAIEILEESDELRDDPRLLAWAAFGPLYLREAGAGRALIDRASERARSQGAVGVLPLLLSLLARYQATTDQWHEAESEYDEAIRLARETGQRADLGAALAGFAWLEARQGHEARCRRDAEEARTLCRDLGVGLYGIWAVQALGDLELGLGRAAEAIGHYDEQRAEMQSLGIADVDVSPAPELVEGHLRLGRRDEAGELAAAYEREARAKGQPWALARAARCRGLLAADEEVDAAFDEALRLHARTPDVFELARTQLAYGARLRRARRRIDAREQLRAAVETFGRLGASSWSEVARGELAATGETARRREASTLDDLTPQELQIALLLAGGKTTREAAAAVFLSPKTVEYHLRHVYRKLDVHSREELATALAATA